ncbi:hypothetical protein AB9P05_13705 [Roseivirga sp. BDSF3-8]|uniref:hypothetical protein n=1 Tax=Roseivirga sp. BDSF3-8 TaxID=3241598 RepID=UPI003532411D
MNRFYLACAGLFLFACGSSNTPNEQALLDSLDTVEEEAPMLSDELVGGILQQIPAPLEISVLIKEAGANYDNALLNDPEKAANYNSNFKRALNLGVYGTDLGYTNIYEQNQDAMSYLNSVKDLADGLSIGQFFDFRTIKQLATNSSNLDSLLLITTRNFNDINGYLQEQKRSNLSVLLLTGGWLEAMHILTEVSEKSPDNRELMERIGEQKIILENIMLLLDNYAKGDPQIAELAENMKGLQTAFEKIQITTIYAEPTSKVVDGVLVIEDNSKTTIDITQEDVDNIKKATDSIRNLIIG